MPRVRLIPMPTFDPQIQTENIAFDAEAMLECPGCGRMNPPNRLKCVYCAGQLAIAVEDAANIKPSLRKVELWERGFSLIVREKMPTFETGEIAKYLSTDEDNIAAILATGTAVPIARVESDKEAVIVQDRLARLGVGCSIVSDEALAVDRPPTRLSAIAILDDRISLTDFNTGQSNEIGAGEFALLVPGSISVDRVDLLEKKRRGGRTKLLDEIATASDEMLLDIYTRRDSTGFRIHLTGFDFSCLADDKGMLAGENLRLLIGRLADLMPSARVVNDYAALRRVLGHVWEVESRKDSRGLQRSGFGKVEFGSTASSNNLNQFTKFSRLQWHLL